MPAEIIRIASLEDANSAIPLLVSFGSKYGKPQRSGRSIQYLNTASRIRNPWHDPALRKLNGLDARVQQFIRWCPKTQAVVDTIVHRLMYFRYRDVGVSCHGGKHRSVAIVEFAVGSLVQQWAEKDSTLRLQVLHRDLEK